jgi:hypothetical protein
MELTPKEKAKKLVQKYLYKVIELSYAETKSKELAKQCALICVNELIDKTQSIEWLKENNLRFDFEYTQEYHLEVKQEIEKLC